MLRPIQCQPLTPRPNYCKKPQPAKPQYFCSNCQKCTEGSYCECFQRPVDKKNNRCFNNSHYIPTRTVFKAAPNIEEMWLEKEKNRYA